LIEQVYKMFPRRSEVGKLAPIGAVMLFCSDGCSIAIAFEQKAGSPFMRVQLFRFKKIALHAYYLVKIKRFMFFKPSLLIASKR